MGIQALPQTAVRAIGASQVLNDPAAVVKELIDNALDARATSIAIEISNNTLDSIQVRDNGHGIPPEDRLLVARPHCTSKIGDENDLRVIGGSSLGFRGEALASVAELSGSLTISTRVEGEQVATGLKINQSGEVDGQDRASLPVGTTIKITDFIRANPVRRQVALKNTEKTFKKIKRVLQSYAFARSNVRFSLRVLKAKNDKANWMYAPKAGGNAEDAAFKIVGAACASQCTWSVVDYDGFTLQAFLPRADSEPSKVCNFGVFLSIDSRPVSACRGMLKQIAKIFRDTLKQTNTSFDGAKDPFMYLDIACPPASYDANVEPAKDDVLFEDTDTVIRAAKKLFEAVYPIQEVQSLGTGTQSNQHVRQQRRAPAKEDDFVTALETPLLERPGVRALTRGDHERSANLLAGHLPTTLDEEHHFGTSPQRMEHVFRTNMYGCDEEDLDLLDARPPTGRTEADFEELRQARKDISVSNPWVIAKLNASVRKPATTPDRSQKSLLENDAHNALPQWSSAQTLPPIDLEAPGLPTPRPSSSSPPAQDFHPSDYVPDVRLGRDGRMIGSQSLPPPQMVIQPSTSIREDAEDYTPHQERRQPPSYDYLMSSQVEKPPAGTPLHTIPCGETVPRRSPQKQQRQAQINKPFVSPFIGQQGGGHRQRPQQVQLRPQQNRDISGLVVQGELGDLIDDPRPLTPPRRNRDMRDFVTTLDLTENDAAAASTDSRHSPQQSSALLPGRDVQLPSDRNEENTAPRSSVLGARGFIPASELAAVKAHFGSRKIGESRATKRRKTSESDVLREVSGNATARGQDEDQDYPPNQSEHRGSRRRRTTDRTKIRRSKSSQLPLEHVPAGQGVQNIVLELPTSIREVSQNAGRIHGAGSLLRWNEPALDAYDTLATISRSGSEEMNRLTARLHDLLTARISDGEMVQDLNVIVADAFAVHKTVIV